MTFQSPKYYHKIRQMPRLVRFGLFVLLMVWTASVWVDAPLPDKLTGQNP